MRWAAGIAVPGVPANPTPARVENLSLGGGGACSATFQSAVDDVVARGTVVVVAAGNSNADAANTQPASCNNVIAVAATTRNGGRASYSNYGAKVAIAAPGGGGNDGVLSTLNTGATTPGADSYAWFQGTSMATPHVAGVASLMLSVNPAMTPAEVLARLRQSARAFPTGTGSDCTTAICGAGIVDAAATLAALVAAPVPAPPPSGWTHIADEGQGFTVSGTQTVRYGSGSSWITLGVTGSGTCSNAFFGNDPIYGVVKRCEVAS
jgi:serine protease